MAQSELPRVGGIEGMEESFDISQRAEVPKLRKGAVGLGGVLFLTVTGSAPISAMLFNTPIMVGYGQGVGAPAAFIFAAIVLVVFSVGYVAMARKRTSTGGFYSYISHGLGRELGIGTGYGAVVAYSVFEASLAGGFAYFLNLKLNAFGVNIGWPWLALGMVVLISLLTFFDVRLSSTLLAIGLISEVAILVIFDIFMFSTGPRRLAARQPGQRVQELPGLGQGLVAGAVGIGLFFAFWSWVGFEMAPNYAEESRNPKRIVPRALYISVIGLGVFYTLTSWAPLFGYPIDARGRRRGPGQRGELLSRPGQPVRRALGVLDHELPDHHRRRSPAGWRSTTPRPGTSTRSAARGCCPRRSAAPTTGGRARTSRRCVQSVDRRAHHHPVRACSPAPTTRCAGLPAAVRADGGDGRDHHPVGAGPGLAGHPGLLPAAPQRRDALVEDPARARLWRWSSQAYVVYLLFDNISFLGSGYYVREVVRPDRPAWWC